MTDISIFDTIKLPIIWYIVLVILASIILIIFGLYFAWEYYQGRALKELFWARVKGWTNHNIALFEIFNPINLARFEYAHKEVGDTYKFGEEYKLKIKEENNGKFSKFKNILLDIFGSKKINKESSYIVIPKSVYTINKVRTIPLFEVYPKLNPIIEKGVNKLLENNINDLLTFEKLLDDKPNLRNTILFDDYTYEKFYELYMTTKNKYELKISINDTINFMSNTFDKNYRFSIEAKEFNIKQKNKDKKLGKKYGMYFLILCGIVSIIMFLYKVLNR